MNDKKRYGEELPPDIKKMLEAKNNSKKVIYEIEMEEKPKKPLEFVIEKTTEYEDTDYKIVYHYDKGHTEEMALPFLPTGLIVGRHYHIDDIYGNTVIDDREGL